MHCNFFSFKILENVSIYAEYLIFSNGWCWAGGRYYSSLFYVICLLYVLDRFCQPYRSFRNEQHMGFHYLPLWWQSMLIFHTPYRSLFLSLLRKGLLFLQPLQTVAVFTLLLLLSLDLGLECLPCFSLLLLERLLFWLTDTSLTLYLSQVWMIFQYL